MAIGDIISNLLDKKETKTASFLWNLLPTVAGTNNIRSSGQKLREIKQDIYDKKFTELQDNRGSYTAKVNAIDEDDKVATAFADTETQKYISKHSVYTMQPINGGNMLVDVVNNYEWTTTPKSGRGTAPYIIMREMQPKTGAELQRAIYALNAFTDGVADTGEKVEKMVDSALNNVGSNLPSSVGSAIKTGAEKFKDIASYLDNKLQELKDSKKIERFTSNMGLEKQSYLNSYNELYNCDYTGWVFKLPYFENTPLTTPQNTFASGTSKTAAKYIADGMEFLNSLLGNFQGTLAQLDSNEERSTETPKSYSMATDGTQFSFKFPLINTEDEYQAASNYQLVQLLKYQSRPYRTSRNLIVPINIYEVFMPGMRYIPYAFIRNINIEFQGVRMPLNMQIMFEDKPTNITAIVPEAYMVNIELQSLTNETGNFMIESMLNKRGF